MKLAINFTLVALFTLFASGCIHYSEQSHIQRPTVGQELADLKSALKSGAINTEEYEVQKHAILDGDFHSTAQCQNHKYHH